MAIELTSLPLPASADPTYFVDFGREVKGVHPAELTPAQFDEIHDALYKVGSVCLAVTTRLDSSTSMASSCSATSSSHQNSSTHSQR